MILPRCTRSLASPAVSPSVSARSTSWNGKRSTSGFRPCSRASYSVSPTRASSGPVKVTRGTTRESALRGNRNTTLLTMIPQLDTPPRG